MSRSFSPVAASLRRRVSAYLAQEGEDLNSDRTRITVATNSTLVAQRGEPIVAMIAATLGRQSVAGLRVVDLGCGFGALALLLAEKGASVVGLDADGGRLGVARAVADVYRLPAEFRLGRMERPGLEPGSFDVALINNSLCYVLDRPARHRSLSEAFLALRPGGIALVRDPNRLYPRDQFTRLPLLGVLPPGAANLVARIIGSARSQVRLRSGRGLRRELAAAGFADVRSLVPPGGRRRMVAYNHVVGRRPAA